MSTGERLVWALCGLAVFVINAVGWWRDEREWRAEKVAHRAELERIRAVATTAVASDDAQSLCGQQRAR